MALADLVRNGVALANKLTGSLQITVGHRSWKGTYDDSGQPLLFDPVPRSALWEMTQRIVRTKDNTLEESFGALTFLEPIPVTSNDRFILPGDTVERAPMNFAGGLADPKTTQGNLPARAYLNVVYLP